MSYFDMAERDRYQIQVVSDVSRDDLYVEIVIDSQSLIELRHGGGRNEVRLHGDVSSLWLDVNVLRQALKAAEDMLATIPR